VVFSQTKDQARHAVGTDDALITVNGKQHRWGILVARDRGNIPRMTERFTKQSLFDFTCGRDVAASVSAQANLSFFFRHTLP
jgi:hypothetical protein